MSLEEINDPLLKRLITYIWRIAVVGAIVAIVLYFGELISNGPTKICLSTACVESFSDRFSPSLDIIVATIKLVVAVSTVGGIIIAVKNYLSTSYSASISNHISNFRVFKDFVDFEVAKLDRVNKNSINTITWYNRVFPASRAGILNVGDGYHNFISEVDAVIETSNKIVSSSQKPDFSYKKHQFKMALVLSKIGMTLPVLDRNDYYQTEEQILKLLHVINVEFCGIEKPIRERQYI
ncbi:retron Ec48 family effector membrane protein [Aliidiomarina indica]|uniref:retron Ec48 family effector membrane protein n=1 Tax=Aliidiomarina indica TaxID=2749147 RepID=UPI00188F071A|nr:retron Ec48 family effector membrane protein [Aliidiomarina indica]